MRIITNRSTGMMAAALAERAFDRGADVDLWMGGCSAQLPDYIPTRRFATVSDLISMVDDIDHDVVLVPAALADFTPESIAKGKISSDDGFELNLNPVPKVLPLIRSKCDTVVGFKAESGLSAEDLIARARSRLEMYDLAAVVANDIDVVGMKSSSAHLVTADSSSDISGTKAEVSDAILDYCVSRL